MQTETQMETNDLVKILTEIRSDVKYLSKESEQIHNKITQVNGSVASTKDRVTSLEHKTLVLEDTLRDHLEDKKNEDLEKRKEKLNLRNVLIAVVISAILGIIGIIIKLAG